MKANDEFMTTTQVMKLLKCSRDVVLGLIKEGHIRAVQVGPKTTRIYKSSVNRFIQDGGI